MPALSVVPLAPASLASHDPGRAQCHAPQPPHGARRSRAFRDFRGFRGFTLIELLVVLAIIGALAALIVPSVLARLDDSRVTTARADVGSLMQALKLYKLDNHRYPSAEQGLDALVHKPTTEPLPPSWHLYVEKLPNDPWGHPYQYVNPGIHGEIDVYSFGADGRDGGEGNDADIGSWQ